MKNCFISVLMFLLLSNLFTQTDFDEFKKQEETKQKNFMETESTARANYYSQQDSLFIQYKDQIENLWNEFLESTTQDWVSYNSDFSCRSKVDFKNHKIEVEAVVEKPEKVADEKKQESKAKELLKKQVISILTEEDKFTKKPILKDQVTTSNKKVIKQNEVVEVADQLVENSKKVTFKNKEGKTLIKYQINLSLIPNNIKIRVEQYKPTIEKLCKKYDVDPSLALAIIHSESFFNPKAYNRHGNAYGMMQIVPKYAGLTMNNYIYKKNVKPTSKQLFDPAINLEMGIGYLRWLAENKWSKVTNKTNQMYCMICSYNGGPGSVYKAMTGRMTKIGDKWDPMFVDLSTMDSKKLFKKLKKDIPFKETRNYIVNVTDKMKKYYNQ
jgi:peptidoglycan lytic transglycosylase C